MAEGPSHFQPFDVVRFPPARILLLPLSPSSRAACVLSASIYRSLAPRSHENKMVTLLKSIEKDDPTRRGIRKAPAAPRTANTREHALDDAVMATDETRLPAKEKN